jgi:SAM-dependent methyltransferase
VSLRRLVRRFLPRRKHSLLDAPVTPAPRDAELRARYLAAVAGESDVFVTQRFEEGLRWREVVRAFVIPSPSAPLRAGSREGPGREAVPHDVALLPAIDAPADVVRPPLPPRSLAYARDDTRRVLDVGAGNGAIELAFSGDPGTFAVSVDALWNTTAARLGVRRVLADASALPFRDGAFDTVLCLETIEHVSDPRGVAREVARVAAGDAVVLVTTPPKWRYALRPDPHFGIRFLTLWPPSLQRRIAAKRGFTGPHHYVDRIYASAVQLRRVFAGLRHEATLTRDRMPGRWFWDALLFRKQ